MPYLSFLKLVTLVATLSLPNLSLAESWKAKQLSASKFPAKIVKETRKKTPNGLPDGLIATSKQGDIVQAWYTEPTKRYGHAILGDGIEAESLVVKIKNGKKLVVKLSEEFVFEDRYPRIVDLDRDGTNEVIVIKSSNKLGGSVSVYGMRNNRLVEKASSGFIGRTNRWLNIAGISDFTGNGKNEISYVQTPHIGGTLFFLSYNKGKMRKIAALDGFSNHAIGSREMRLSAIADVNGDGLADLAVPSVSRQQLRIVGFVNGKLKDLGHVFLPSKIDKAIAVTEYKNRKAFIVGLSNGEIYQIHK